MYSKAYRCCKKIYVKPSELLGYLIWADGGPPKVMSSGVEADYVYGTISAKMIMKWQLGLDEFVIKAATLEAATNAGQQGS